MRYAILSDVHGNLPALQAVLDDLATQDVTTTLYLGDAVGYYADSRSVVEALCDVVQPWPQPLDREAAQPRPWVPGNHEWGLLGNLSEDHFDQQALIPLRRTRAEMPPEMIDFLASLPPRIELHLDQNLDVTLVHASPTDPIGSTGGGYITNGEDAAMAARHFNTRMCLVGHTHSPQIFYETQATGLGYHRWAVINVFEAKLPGGVYHFEEERLILNPGSVGQPRDSDPRASYAILDTTACTFSVRRIPYNLGRTQELVRRWLADVPRELLDKPGGLADRLSRGL